MSDIDKRLNGYQSSLWCMLVYEMYHGQRQ